jgi:hypothetical protein
MFTWRVRLTSRLPALIPRFQSELLIDRAVLNLLQLCPD